MERPILTIAIPTYNRKELLIKSLNCAYEQVSNKNIEIFVSDNASTDGTYEFMINYIKDHPEVSYYRNENNIGPDGNFINCYTKAQGKYTYILSDDDFLLPGAINSILEGLRENPTALFINCGPLGDKASDDKLRSNMVLDQNYIIDNRDDIFSLIDIHITFLTSMIVKTDLVKHIDNIEQYIGSFFIQSYVMLNTMKNDELYVFNTYKCFDITGNNKISYDLYYVWFESYKKVIYEGGKIAGISKKILDKVFYNSLKSNLFYFVCHFRKNDEKSDNWDKQYLFNNIKEYPELKYLYKWALMCPRSLLKIYNKLGRAYIKLFLKG